MTVKIMTEYAVTSPPKHHFFGFHDLVAWNASGNKLLALETDRIDVPVYPGQKAGIGYVDCTSGRFVKVGETNAFNYPQGARQQWVGDTDIFTVNDQVGDKWGCRVYDAGSHECVAELEHPAHVVDGRTHDCFGINYARLFRLGAYGYAGLPDETAGDNLPSNDGIVKHNIETGKAQMIISIRDVAEKETGSGFGKYTHYVTHLALDPSGTRVAFLHRYRTGEGEVTRLMTVGTDGSNLRCLASGFLSHFDWMDNCHLMIWGRSGSAVEKLRGSRLYSLVPRVFLRVAKRGVKRILRGGTICRGAGACRWLVFRDREPTEMRPIAEHINEDGHLMFCPANRDWMVCDNYPDEHGVRTLFLYQFSQNRRIDIGSYKRLFKKPDMAEAKRAMESVDMSALYAADFQLLAFTRSGLHCDLHPRWKSDGTQISFDSIHEGTRQIYVIDVTPLMKTDKGGIG
jgi:hypothetical protein